MTHGGSFSAATEPATTDIPTPTMVRGNWQKRVESAQARREEQRARKARKGDREAYRQMASGLMSYLASYDGGPPSGSSGGADAHQRQPPLMHVWVDSDPRKSGGGGGVSGSGNGRAPAQDSAGFDSDDEDGGRKRGKKGGGKKQSRRPQQGSAKKAHPRQGLKNSHHFDDDEGASGANAQQLCVRHFFYNKCAGLAAAGKKGGGGKGGAAVCKLQHMRDTTLALALKKVGEAEGDIAASASAVVSTSVGGGEDEDEQVGGGVATSIVEDASMSMLWYLPVSLEDDTENDSGRGINEILQSVLSKNKLGAATIVYVCLGKRLLYDRNRGGVIEEPMTVAGDDIIVANDGDKPPRKHGRSRGESMAERKGSMCDGEDTEEANLLLHFPASVLESILTYLPDMYTGNLPRVCKAWNAEIGKTSPNLWYQLLLRRDLPLPVEKSAEGFLLPAGVDAETAGSPRDICRNAFVGHYQAFRDLRAIHQLFLKLEGQTTQTIAPTEACFMHYNSSPGAPREGSGSVSSMKVWSEGKILAAFEEDCTLRLFEAVSAGESNLACRQTVSVVVSPEPKSKRGQWEMTGMDLDDLYVSCICQSGGRWDFNGDVELSDIIKAPVMHVIKREDLLCASGAGSDNRPGEIDPDDVLSVDLRDAVCEHLLKDCWGDLLSSTKESDADLVDLIENEERSDLLLHVNKDIVACGRGRFLFKAALLTRDMDPDDEQVSFRAYLFSVSTIKITWSEMCHVSLPFSLPYVRMVSQKNSTGSMPSAIISHPRSDRTTRLDVSKDGGVHSYEMPIGASLSAAIVKEKSSWHDYDEAVQVEERGWSVSTHFWKPVLLTSSDIFISCHEVLYNAPSGEVKGRTVVTFSSAIERDSDSGGATTDSLTLKGRCRIDDMQLVGIDHVALIGQMLPEESQTTSQDEGIVGDDEENNIAGEWFGVADDNADDGEGDDNNEGNQNRDSTAEGGYCISLIHIPSRREIKRYRMMPGRRTGSNMTFASASNTVVVEAAGGGLIMSGRGVRDALDQTISSTRSDDVTPKSKKKKRQATRAKGRNKDGFARGMSGRG